MMTLKSETTFKLKGDNLRVCMQDFKIRTDNKIENKKYSNELTDKDQISIVSDAMFKTMLANSERKKFPCKLLAGLLDNSFEELLENAEFHKNELDKTSVETKNERSDLVLKIGGDYIIVEMNMRQEIGRNIEYSDKLYRSKVKVGSDYVYSKVLSVNLNNFYFEGYDKIVDVFHTQNEDGVLLDHKTSVQIFLPLLYKKCYNQGEEALSELEKTILVMTSPDRDYASKLAKDDDILEEYLEEAKKVEKDDNFLREAYDHELSGKLASYETGFDKGQIEGEDKIIKDLLISGMTPEKIHEITNIPLDRIKTLK